MYFSMGAPAIFLLLLILARENEVFRFPGLSETFEMPTKLTQRSNIPYHKSINSVTHVRVLGWSRVWRVVN